MYFQRYVPQNFPEKDKKKSSGHLKFPDPSMWNDQAPYTQTTQKEFETARFE